MAAGHVVPLLALLWASSLAPASAWNCSAWAKAEQASTGGFCTDHDQGHVVPAGTLPVAFGEKTCSTGEAFFYGEDAGKTYVWCAASCASGCGTDMPQCKALYRRKCDGAAPPPPDTIGGLVLVPQGPRGAACLDGSPPGYWMDEASAASNASKWVIHAQGGGWCWNETECAERATGALGSSKGWTQVTSCYGKCDGILSKNSTENPDFSSWNRACALVCCRCHRPLLTHRCLREHADVWVGYCDGSSFSGRVSGLHHGLHYRGRPNLDAVLDSLIAKNQLDKASDVVFTGGSAGGLTTYLQVDHVKSRLPAVKTVKGLGDAGWFLDAPTWNGETVSRTEFTYAFNMWNSSTGVNDACVANNAAEAWRCIFAQYTYPHIATPTFVAEGGYDSCVSPPPCLLPLLLSSVSPLRYRVVIDTRLGSLLRWQLGNLLKLPCRDCSGGMCKSGGGCPKGTKANCCNNASYTTAFLVRASCY